MPRENPSYTEPIGHRIWNSLTGKGEGVGREAGPQGQTKLDEYAGASKDIRKIPFSERKKIYNSLGKRDTFKGTAEQNRFLKSHINASSATQIEASHGTQYSKVVHSSRTLRERLRQGVTSFTAPRRFDPRETAQMIKDTFGRVDKVILPRSNGQRDVAERRGSLFYFQGSNRPCYMLSGEIAEKFGNNSQIAQQTESHPEVKKVKNKLFGGWFEKMLGNARGNTKETLINVTGEAYYVNQDKKNNCGPTACAIAAAKLKGLNPMQLRNLFTKKSPGAMDWSTPEKLLQPLGLQVQQRDSLSPSSIDRILKNGGVVLASTTPKSGLTKGGHIIALTESIGTAPSYAFKNADPNIRNIQKGLGIVRPDQLAGGGAKQYWIVT